MNQREIWKDIPDYVGYYQVSDLGRVKSLARATIRSNGRKYPVQERIMKPSPSSWGYLQTVLRKNGTLKTVKIHKLVSIAFLNHIPCGHTICVDHIDNDKLNNRLDNLQLISSRGNASKDRVSSSQYTGVSWAKNKNKWVAQIRIDGEQTYLGRFTNELEASEAYKNKLKEINLLSVQH